MSSAVGATLTWSDELSARCSALLARANGRRTARRLELGDAQALCAAVLEAPEGYGWRDGGPGGDARQQTTLLLAVRTAAGVVLGVAAVRAGAADPARAWPELDRWETHPGAHHGLRCQQWAAARADDRLLIPVLQPRPATAEDGLWAELLARPDDDGPRRVLADLLLERGDPRGELLAVQLELAAAAPADPKRTALVAAQRRLLDAHRGRWAPDDPRLQVEFERGLPCRVTVTDPSAFAAFPAFLERNPIQHLRLTSTRGLSIERLGAAPWLSRLRTLALVNPRLVRTSAGPLPKLGAEELGALLESRGLRHVDALRIGHHALGDVGAMVLAANAPGVLPALRSLSLEDCGVGEIGAQALARTKWLGALESLDLAENELGPGGVEALAFARSAGRLERLGLARTAMGDRGALMLATAPRLVTLKALDVAGNRIGALGAQALLDSRSLAGLQALELSGNPVGRKVLALHAARFPSRR